jgi:hypothetical protein
LSRQAVSAQALDRRRNNRPVVVTKAPPAKQAVPSPPLAQAQRTEREKATARRDVTKKDKRFPPTSAALTCPGARLKCP